MPTVLSRNAPYSVFVCPSCPSSPTRPGIIHEYGWKPIDGGRMEVSYRCSEGHEWTRVMDGERTVEWRSEG